MKNKSLITTLILLILNVCAISMTSAAPIGKIQSVPASARLISPITALGDNQVVRLGIFFNVQPGWKIYAPNPQNSAYEDVQPQIHWKGTSRNFTNVRFEWPTPKEIEHQGEMVRYYEGQTIVPITFNVDNPNNPLILKGTLKYVACKELCVPIEDEINFVLEAGLAAPTEDAPLLIKKNNADSRSTKAEISLLAMIAMAFIGGLILNFMPCVLPILTLKVMTFKKISKHSYDFSYRLRFLASFMGIMTSFLFFAVGIISLKAVGGSIGWGMHFQQPLFLTFMAAVMTLFACNLWGFFDIHLPAGMSKGINNILGSQKTTYKVLSGDFLSGAFATLLATPCTAPFLGTAIGYSFSKGTPEILMLFIFLGLGFATPYWLGLVLPKNWLKFPKAGAWMTRLTFVLGWGLIATVLWMLWIISKQESLISSILIGVLLTLIILSFKMGKKNAYLIASLLAGCFAISIIVPDIPQTAEEQKQQEATTFDPQKIKESLSQGKIVFVDVHAKWCITCQVNHSLVLNTPEIKKLLESDRVEVISADWTLRDDTIAQFLQDYGRFGIPFNIVFGPKAPDGIVLSEILSGQDVMQALKDAGFEE
ncbi:MAG: cytochrome c biogenesis protein CcdA [Candidatus Nucleicultricaceae bacterium]